MDAKTFLRNKSIFDELHVYDIDGESFELSQLLTEYAESLQLLQTAVVGQSEQLCNHCGSKLCDSQTFNQQCFKCGKKPS
jgi:hypothetical protein